MYNANTAQTIQIVVRTLTFILYITLLHTPATPFLASHFHLPPSIIAQHDLEAEGAIDHHVQVEARENSASPQRTPSPCEDEPPSSGYSVRAHSRARPLPLRG